LFLPTVIGFTVLLASYMIFNADYDGTWSSRWEHRLLNEREADDSLIGRGYDRIRDNSEMLLFGAGSAGFRRFKKKQGFYFAVHSTYGNVLFTVGLFGVLCLLMYHKFYFSAWDYRIVFIIPLIFHSLFHDDIRSIFTIVIPKIYYFLTRKTSYNG